MNFTDIINAITAPFGPAGTIIGAAAGSVVNSSSVQDSYEKLTDVSKAKVKAWWQSVLNVKNTPIPNDPELAQWRQDILDRAETIKKMIVKLVNEEAVKDMGLGLAPVAIVGGVAIAGVLGYITYQTADIVKYFTRLNFIKSTAEKLTKANVPPADALKQAMDAADAAGQTNGNRILGIPVRYILIGSGAAIVIWVLFGRKKNEIILAKDA